MKLFFYILTSRAAFSVKLSYFRDLVWQNSSHDEPNERNYCDALRFSFFLFLFISSHESFFSLCSSSSRYDVFFIWSTYLHPGGRPPASRAPVGHAPATMTLVTCTLASRAPDGCALASHAPAPPSLERTKRVFCACWAHLCQMKLKQAIFFSSPTPSASKSAKKRASHVKLF